MIRHTLAVLMMLCCPMCVVAAPASGQDDAPTCGTWPVPPIAFHSTRDRDAFASYRLDVVRLAQSLDEYAVCMNTALAVLKDDRQKSGGTVSSIIEGAVAQSIANTVAAKRSSVESFNDAVDRYNASHPAEGDPLPPLDLSLDPPPSNARTLLPAGSRLLSIPGLIVGRTHDCRDLYPDALVKLHQGVRTIFTYDVAADGSIGNVQMLQSSGVTEIDVIARACVTTLWRNTPVIRDGEPVASQGLRAIVPVPFDLKYFKHRGGA